MHRFPLAVGLAAAISAASCDDGLAPDFELTDTNPASATYLQPVSPRDFVGRVSAWYFGNAG